MTCDDVRLEVDGNRRVNEGDLGVKVNNGNEDIGNSRRVCLKIILLSEMSVWRHGRSQSEANPSIPLTRMFKGTTDSSVNTFPRFGRCLTAST